jgi:hypothetical protein
MKTPEFLFLAILPPAAMLLSHCASTGSVPPQASGSRASPPTFRQQVSYRPAMGDWFENPSLWDQSETLESEPEWLVPLELTIQVPERPEAVEIPPLVVTATTIADVAPEGWPSDVVDAEDKAAWIVTMEADAPRHHATEISVDEWTKSLR